MAREKDAAVLVVGAGIAGLSAAIALAFYGIDVLLFERERDARRIPLGSGLFLGYNVSRAFRHLGLLDDLVQVTAPTTYFEYTDYRGRLLGTQRSPEGELQLGVVRPALHDLLLDNIDEGVIQSEARLARFEQDRDGVTAHFEGGREARGDVLIGADGMFSTVRRQLVGESKERYAGYVARRGVLESELANEERFRMAVGRGKRFIFYPVGRRLLYWTAVTSEPPVGLTEDGATRKRIVLERFRGFVEPTEELVESTDEERTFHADIYDRKPIRRWGEGRVTMLGDSAHPTTFNIGQGAGQSIEGAVFLAKYLKEAGDDVEAALRRYEAERIPRTRTFTRISRWVGAVGQWQNPAACAVRNNVLAKIAFSEGVTERGDRELQVEF